MSSLPVPLPPSNKQTPPAHLSNMKISFIEPAILLNAFAMTLTIPLTAQYVYRRIWEETGNYTFASGSNVSECAQNKSDPIFAFREVRN